jgi:hypothetical protein
MARSKSNSDVMLGGGAIDNSRSRSFDRGALQTEVAGRSQALLTRNHGTRTMSPGTKQTFADPGSAGAFGW